MAASERRSFAAVVAAMRELKEEHVQIKREDVEKAKKLIFDGSLW